MPQTPGLTINIPEPTWRDAADQFIKNISQIAMIVIIFMFAGTIAEEKNKKTLEIVLTKPISRKKFVLAKFLSSFVITKLVFIGCSVIFYAYTVSLFGQFSAVNFIWLVVFTLVYLILIEALTIFFSAISSSQILAVGLAFVTEIVFATAISYIKKAADYSPTYILSNYKHLMENGNFADFLPSAAISVAVIVLLAAAAAYLFQNQEIER
jgi:ABC-2 type transport system permease protein